MLINAMRYFVQIKFGLLWWIICFRFYFPFLDYFRVNASTDTTNIDVDTFSSCIELNWITLFKVSYVMVKLHNSSHLLKVCLNNANRNENSITHFVWYLETEKRDDIERLSIDRVSDKEHLYRKMMQKMCRIYCISS